MNLTPHILFHYTAGFAALFVLLSILCSLLEKVGKTPGWLEAILGWIALFILSGFFTTAVIGIIYWMVE